LRVVAAAGDPGLLGRAGDHDVGAGGPLMARRRHTRWGRGRLDFTLYDDLGGPVD